MNDVELKGWEIVRFKEGTALRIDEEVAEEFPFTVIVNGEELATMVCSPSHLHDLVVGFLASEGIIRFYNQISQLQMDEDRGFAHIELTKPMDVDQHDYSKRFIGSCCGKSRQFYFKSDVKTAKTITSKLMITVDQCISLMQTLQRESEQFIRTGGVHNAALANRDELLEVRTDIGRHNALDKIYGHMLKEYVQPADKLIVFSGRISSEVLLKISKIGVGILISKSAPTDLALKLAMDLGITVIGFARGSKMNVYTHPHRVVEANR
ncbi:formate dehydrogenase accessory sulfurtransferase FdhD [Virgibacillus sp. NKC19-3]|uniref:formate dehydrogenase accessory sulfurtransferase FdhD n=1 Tax=Virgibacillus saliphilus TaxID=2831674 RepID=UPI001C9AE16D|nr:formate dehydrogenase accessory sulfurtransferase FdhD [Virgibacillus sp. NKC19-3]MBY7142047.1 formate dehydrogenase accessory sulfurtransferase FdhD [Virgibacillus sp. NKC19-3]